MKIKTVVGQDDFACMAEAVHRRYARLLREAQGETVRENEEDKPLVEELRKLMKNPGEAYPKLSEAEHRENAPLPKVISGVAAGFHIDAPVERKLPLNMPDLIVIDGGKGQLNAACAELAKLGLDSIPTIGLAKEFEEIYFPGAKEPLRLSHESNALKLLQRIRDESHRVANSYNAQLRIKRISESILDEFPGIGERRKAALLKKFGSVQRLRLARVEEIAEVPGFGGKAAAELKTFLDARSGELLENASPADGPDANG